MFRVKKQNQTKQKQCQRRKWDCLKSPHPLHVGVAKDLEEQMYMKEVKESKIIACEL